MAYYFFFGDTMIPVPPPKMSLKINNKDKTINLINEGEAAILKTPGLTSLSFTLMLPNTNYPFVNSFGLDTQSLLSGGTGAFSGAKSYISMLENYKTTRQPFQFVVVRMKPNFQQLFHTNLRVSLAEYTLNEDASNGFDISADIKLVQYKEFGTKRLTISTDSNGNKTASLEATRATDNTVPYAITVAQDLSIYEAVKKATNGTISLSDVMNLNDITQTFKVTAPTPIILNATSNSGVKL